MLPGSAVVLGVVVVVEILLIHFKTRADIFNRTFSVLLYVFLAYLAGEAVVNHARAGNIWRAWSDVLVAFALFVTYHLMFGSAFLLPFAASTYFGSLAWGAVKRRSVPMREVTGAVVALFFSGMLLLPLPVMFVRAWPVVVLSLVLSAVLCRWGTVRLQRAAWLHDPFGTGALAFFAGVWFSAGVLIFREVTGLME